jgi:hypothetical protein
MKVIQANPAFFGMFGVTPKQTEQSVFFDLGNGQWNIPQLRELLQKVLSKNSQVRDFEVTHNFPGIGKRTMQINARSIFHLGVGTDTVLLAFEDVSRVPRGARGAMKKERRETPSGVV